MANRSYLYSTNVIPGPYVKMEERKLVGISECNYDIPIVFKLLLSGNPRVCKSSIWEVPEDIALVGDYARGVEHLKEFMQEIKLAAAQPLIGEALDFLNKPENQNQFFVLECGEIFEMESEPIPEQNLALLEEIKGLEPQIQKSLQSLLTPKEPSSIGFFSKLFGAKLEEPKQSHDPMKLIYTLGLGNWSNILYHDFTDA